MRDARKIEKNGQKVEFSLLCKPKLSTFPSKTNIVTSFITIVIGFAKMKKIVLKLYLRSAPFQVAHHAQVRIVTFYQIDDSAERGG